MEKITVVKDFNGNHIKSDIHPSLLSVHLDAGWVKFVEPNPAPQLSAKTQALIDGKSK